MVTKKAGCIVINLENKTIALVCRNGEYSFPKGHLEKDETLIECAIRECIEETGHDCHSINDNCIDIIRYTTPKGEDVENYMYLAIDDGLTNKEIAEKDKEKTEWFSYNEIYEKLSHQDLKEFWENVKNQVKNIIGT